MVLLNIEIQIAANKKFYFPVESQYYKIIGLGGYKHDGLWLPVCDDTGENISKKNFSYSELSGWYWLAKNKSLTEFIGLAHYRRLLLLDINHPEFEYSRFLRLTPSYEIMRYLTSERLLDSALKILEQDLIIVPRSIPIGESIADHYRRHHLSQDWNLFILALKEVMGHGSNEVSFFDNSQNLIPYNMAIWRSSIFKKYIEDLFSILEWMDIHSSPATDFYQCRRPAFIAERFFTYYISINSIKTFSVPVILLDPAAS